MTVPRKWKDRTAEYSAWSKMIQRCHSPNHYRYNYYGARGIAVCDRWRNSFELFLADVGERPTPKHSLGRIDNDGNYEPSNVRWETPVQQQRNRRSTSLTYELVAQIRTAHAAGESDRSIANRLGLSVGAVNCAARGLTWKEVA